ncbi:hypothetical protein [Rhodopseudomonas palustris]|uniref:hypothetical protein n=1 Tax=Rhodopseudomonas palustris TaxID=1076 RepID=UPI0002E9B00B
MLSADQRNGHAAGCRALGESRIPRAQPCSIAAIGWAVLAERIERDCGAATAAAFASGLRRPPPPERWTAAPSAPEGPRKRYLAARPVAERSTADVGSAWLPRGLFVPLP